MEDLNVKSDLVQSWVVVQSPGQQSIPQGSLVLPPLSLTQIAGLACWQNFSVDWVEQYHKMFQGGSSERWVHQISNQDLRTKTILPLGRETDCSIASSN